jgi:FkbM family methyltransferase
MGILDKLNIVVTKNVYGVKTKIPIIGKIGINNMVDGEKWLYSLFKKLHSLKKGSVIDVGINIGQTLIKFKSIDKEIDYYGFEPNPSCIYYAHQLTKVNKFNNVKIYPVGLADAKSLLTLYADNEIASGASILEKFRENYKANFKYSIPVWNFDDIDIETKEVSIVKIDVEGFELEVFKGMSNLLLQSRPYIVCEILPVYSLEKENGKYRYKRQQELVKLLKEHNYEIYLIDENNKKLNHLEEIPVHGDMSKTNYVFSHKEEIKVLSNLAF